MLPYPNMRLPIDIMMIILRYADTPTKLTFAQIHPECAEVAFGRAFDETYDSLEDSTKALLPRQSALELISKRSIPEFMHKHYSARPKRSRLTVEQLDKLGQACHQLLSKTEGPDKPVTQVDSINRLLTVAESSAAKDLAEIGACMCLLLTTYPLMACDLLAIFQEDSIVHSSRGLIRISSGILIPPLALVLFLMLLESKSPQERLNRIARNIIAPDSATRIYRKWLCALIQDRQSEQGRFLTLGLNDRLYLVRKNAAIIALTPPALYCTVFHPEILFTFLPFIFCMLADADLSRESSRRDNILFNLKPLYFLAILVSTFLICYLVYQDQGIHEWVDTNTYTTHNYNRSNIALATANFFLLSQILLIHFAPRILKKSQATGRAFLNGWRTTQSEVDIELGQHPRDSQLSNNNSL